MAMHQSRSFNARLSSLLRSPLLYLVLGVAMVKAAFLLFSYHLIVWDEAVFLGMGKWIFSGGSIGLWEQIRPPGMGLMLGLLWFLWGSIAGLFGDFHVPYQAYHLMAGGLVFLFSIGTVVMTYLLGKRLFGKKAGIVAGAMLIATPVFFFYSNQIMTGIPSVFFILLAVYLCLSRRYALSGVVSAAAFLIRYPAGLVLVAINMILLYELLWKAEPGRSSLLAPFDRLSLLASSGISSLLKWPGKKAQEMREQGILFHMRAALAQLRPFLHYNLPFLVIFLFYLLYNRLMYGDYLMPLLLASSHQSTLIGDVHGTLAGALYYPYVLMMMNVMLLFFIFWLWNGRDHGNQEMVGNRDEGIISDALEGNVGNAEKGNVKDAKVGDGRVAFEGNFRNAGNLNAVEPAKSFTGRDIHYAIVPLLVFFLYFTSIPHKQPRFALLFLPFVCMIAAAGLLNFLDQILMHPGWHLSAAWKRRYLKYLQFAAIGLFFLHPLYLDYSIFKTLPQEEPFFVDSYHRYFEIEGAGLIPDGGMILTADPVPAAYTDLGFIHFYNNITDAAEITGRNLDKADALYYLRDSFPCADAQCYRLREDLEQDINRRFSATVNVTWWGGVHQIYME